MKSKCWDERRNIWHAEHQWSSLNRCTQCGRPLLGAEQRYTLQVGRWGFSEGHYWDWAVYDGRRLVFSGSEAGESYTTKREALAVGRREFAQFLKKVSA